MKKTAENHRARKNRKSRLVKALRRAAFTAFLAALLGGNAHAVNINGEMIYGTPDVPAGTKLSQIFFQGTTSVSDAVLIFPGDTIISGDGTSLDERLSIATSKYGTVQIGANLTIQNNGYTGNGNVYGGAIDNQGTLSLTGTTGNSLIFENNKLNPSSQNAYGGAVSNRGTLTFLTFSDLGTLRFTGNKVTACKAQGGAIYNLAGATLTFNDIGTLTFSDNEAKNEGGAIYTETSLDFTGVETLSFTGNKAVIGSGGGIYASSVDDLELKFGNDVTFSGNFGDIGGGAVCTDAYLAEEVVRFGNGATVVGNRAVMSGGAFATKTLIFGDKDAPEGVTTVSGNWVTGGLGLGGAGQVESLTINGAATITDNYSGSHGGAFHLQGLNSIAISTLNATGGDIVFSGNKSGVDFGGDPHNPTNGRANSLYLVKNIDLQLTGDGNIYFDDPITSDTTNAENITLTKTGTGFVQFQGTNTLNKANKAGGTVSVEGGTFRLASSNWTTGLASFIVGTIDEKFQVGTQGTLAGSGIIWNNAGFDIYGTISPDLAVLTPGGDHSAQLSANRYGTLILTETSIQTTTLHDGFRYIYDADSNNIETDTTVQNAVTGDLLALLVPAGGGTINLNRGTVELRGDLAEGYYHLIMATNADITLPVGSDPNDVLTATQGGLAYEPRWTTEFVWGGAANDDKKNIWLGTTRNTLIVTWTGNETNTWAANDGVENWISSQDNGDGTLFSKTFYDGDFVAFSPNPGVEQTIAIDNGGVKVSGFEFGGEGTTTFTGTGGITFVNRVDNPDLVKGNYLHLFNDSSILHKAESGTLVFQNGANAFTGITAGGGTIAFNDVAQLGTGTIAFTDDTTFRADAHGMTLAHNVSINDGKTATVNTQDNTFTLSNTITGTLGTLAKDGSGRLILTSVGSAYQNTLVTDGTFEIYYVQSLGTNGVNLVAATSRLDFNLTVSDSSYAGQITGNGSVYVRSQNFPSISILTLTNADNSYTGGTTVEQGSMLAITHATQKDADGNIIAAGSVGTGNIVLRGSSSRLEIQLAEDGELANIISGDGLLNMDSPDKTLTLSGDSIHTGGVIIVNGSVVIGSATALGNGDAVLAGVNGSSLISNLEQTIANTIVVSGTGTVLQATEHLTVAGTTRSFSLEAGSSLTVNADGANILAETDVEAVSGTTLTKTGTGTFQVSADSVDFSGTMNVNEGDFRVVDGKTFGAAASILNLAGTPASPASISGNGVFVGTTATINGTIDPTGKKLNPDGTETEDSVYATLWLQYDTVTLDGFTLQYDAQDVTTSDLLQIIGQAQIVGGTINVRTPGNADLAAGRYLVVNSSASITDGSVNLTDATLNNLVGLTLNGAAYTDFSPRGNFHLELEDFADTASQIWLSTELNSLTMDWTGASGTAWNVTDGNWQSLQINGSTRENQFLGGDKVHLAGTPASPVTITLDTDVTVSGLVAGETSGGTPQNGDVTISGTGSITADASSAFGKYVNDSLTPTGKLEKFGTGTLTVANTGGNRFLAGTVLYDGTIHLAATAALGATTGVADELEGFVYFATAGLPTESRTVEVAADVDSIQNHFRVTVGTDNTFRNLGALTISGVENNSASGSGNELGGAFFIGTGTALTFDVRADLTLAGNSYNDGAGPVANDIYLMEGSTLNVNVADGSGMFVGSGILGDGGVSVQKGTIVLNGTGTAKSGAFQIAANSAVANTDVQSGRLRLADNAFLANSESFTLAADAFLEGSGTVNAVDNHWINGIVTPDLATFTSGTDTVGDDNIGTLRFTGGRTDFDDFTFQYDVVAANGTNKDPDQTSNDLIQLASQDVYIHGGTVDFRTATSTGSLATGKYLVIDSVAATFMDTNGVVLDDSALNTVLSGQVNGTEFGLLGPRTTQEFYFDTNNVANPDSQIWLKVERNTLEMLWQGGDGVWTTAGNWQSVQTNGTVRETGFQGGDFVKFQRGGGVNPRSVEIAALGVIVSGLDVDLGSGDVLTFTGAGGIRAVSDNDPGSNDIEGQYAKTDGSADPTKQEFNTTGKLEKYGAGTLTFANGDHTLPGFHENPINTFNEGIDIYTGTVAYSSGQQLIVGSGKSITFKGNATLQATGLSRLDTNIVSETGVTGTLRADDGVTMILNANISGAGNITKTGTGTLQSVNGSSTVLGGTTTISEGTWRMIGGSQYGTTNLVVGANGTLAGGGLGTHGIVNVNAATINGTISPDDYMDTIIGTQIGDKIGILVLQGTGANSTVMLDGFTLKFDGDTNYDTAGPKDLLAIDATTVNLKSGAVQFSSLVSGRHLLIDATSDITLDPGKTLDGINDTTNGVLTALNSSGNKIKNDTVRGRLEFVYGNDGNDKTQVWADAKRNSLTMRNVGTYFESLQGDDTIDGQHKARTIVNGDALVLTNNDTENPYVFNTTDWQLAQFAVEGDGDVEITDIGGLLTSDALTATEGDYVESKGGTIEPFVPVTGKFVKTGAGTTIFSNTGTNVFQQGAEIDGGTLDIRTNLTALYLNIGNTASGTTAVLTGTGPITTTDGLTIASGSTLKPGGLSRYDEQNGTQTPSATFMNVTGDLTFEAGGIYSVAMTQYDDGVSEKFVPISDCVVVQNGTVTIVDGALLDVTFDYWNGTILETDLNSSDSDYFTIIELVGSSIATDSTLFTLNESNLPIGVMLAQGWNAGEYRLWFTNDPTTDFETIGKTHNQKEIGRILDDATDRRDAGLKDLVDHISNIRNENGDPDETRILKVLDHLAGDLHFNSLMTALSQPWRYSFRQLDRDRSYGSSCDPCAAVCGTKTGKRQLWGETFGRYDDVDSDGNASGYTINRWGVAVGVDQKISSRAVLGFSFDYSNPILRQATGRTDADNYGFGGYGLVRLNDRYDLKFYAGYSHQSYDIDRSVFIPETNRFAALSERFKNSADGDTFSTSLELSRTFKMNRRLSLSPLLALDYEKAWMDGYRESGGLTALEYGRSSVERFMMRFGLDVDYKLRKNLELNARIQYGTQLNDKEYAFGDVRFVNSTLDDPMSGDIHGVRLGRDYLNLGIGADWKLNTRRDVSLFVNYDADIYRRATMHVGQVGLVLQW